jgi:hypothetical protein
MSAEASRPTRRGVLTTSATTAALGLATLVLSGPAQGAAPAAKTDPRIHPFRVNVAEAHLADLRRRVPAAVA